MTLGKDSRTYTVLTQIIMCHLSVCAIFLATLVAAHELAQKFIHTAVYSKGRK